MRIGGNRLRNRAGANRVAGIGVVGYVRTLSASADSSGNITILLGIRNLRR